MKSHVTFAHKTVVLVILAAVALAFLASCDRITGDTNANQRPQVFFVNVPPDNHSTSFDPVVYWIGSDQDGLVEYFRYIVVREDEMGGQTPDVYRTTTLPNLPDSMWVRLDVTTDDPQTTNVVPMSASLDDPVNTYVPQYVFVQCFDDEGLGSVIEYKLFQRNDNPPESDILLSNMTYINSVNPGGVITGVRFQLEGEDPDEADSLFEFQWKVFGPFEYDSTAIDGGEWGRFQTNFLRQVFVTNDAQVFFYGENIVDTIVEYRVTETGIDTVETILLIDTITANNFYGQLDSVFDVEAFQAQDTENKTIDSSFNGVDGWVSNSRNYRYSDSLYNLFRNDNLNVTRTRKFLVWAQVRDGAEVADVTPAFKRFEAVDPQYERDVLVLDFSNLFGRINAPYKSGDYTALDYWKTVIDNWSTNEQGGAISYDRDDDFVLLQRVNGQLPLDVLLAYKIIILYHDDVVLSPNPVQFYGNITGIGAQVFTAIDAGVNVWATWRAPATGSVQNPPTGGKVETVIMSSSFQQYFGVSEIAYSGWAYYARDTLSRIRIEDFIGAAPLSNAVGWPTLSVDTGQMHSRYDWPVKPAPGGGKDSSLTWSPPPPQLKPDSNCFALPEVDWSVRITGTEPLYLYTSYYGPRHPAGNDFAFDGTPVAIRLETDLYRTVHFNFTPLAIQDDSMQVVIDTVLNWLYDSSLRSPTAATRYPGARIRLSVDQARAMAIDRREREAEMLESLRPQSRR